MKKLASLLTDLCPSMLNTIGNPAFPNFVTLEKVDFAKFLAEYRTSRCLFCEKFCKVFLFWYHEISKRRVAKPTETNGLNLLPQIRGIGNKI